MTPKQQIDYVQRNAWGTSQLGLLAGMGNVNTSGDVPALLDESSPFRERTNQNTPTDGPRQAPSLRIGSPVVYGLFWTAPAVVGGAISGLVASSTTRGAVQGAMWAGGGAATTAGALMLLAGKKFEGWGFLIGGLGLSGYAAWRAITKA